MPKTVLKQPSELRGFPTRLRGLLKELALTQQDLEKLSGVSQSAISRLMSGRDNGGYVLHALLIANAANVRLGWLLLGEEPRALGKPPQLWNADAKGASHVAARAKDHKK